MSFWQHLEHVERFYDGNAGETLLAMALARCAGPNGG